MSKNVSDPMQGVEETTGGEFVNEDEKAIMEFAEFEKPSNENISCEMTQQGGDQQTEGFVIIEEQQHQIVDQILEQQVDEQPQIVEQQILGHQIVEQPPIVEHQQQILEHIQGNQIVQMTSQEREKQAKEYKEINEQHQILENIQKSQVNQSRDVPDFKNKVQDYERENRDLKIKVRDLENKLKNDAIEYDDVVNKLIDREEKIQKMNDKIDYYYRSSNHYKNECENLRNQIGRYKRVNDNLSRELDGIKNANEALQKEAAEYQSKLGDARNYRLGDDDRNNSTRLTQDIEELQNNINTYARVKKGVELNMEMAKRGLLAFGCSLESPTSTDEMEDNKMLIKALLQRIVLKTIMDKIEEYLGRITNLDVEYSREYDIFKKSIELIESTTEFADSRVGKDEVSHVTPTKIRQQVFALLGDRGFSDIKSKYGIVEHPFIAEIASILDQHINKYRTFKNEDKKKEYDELAPNIIREVIKIFYFRCKVQEPEAEFVWIEKGEKIDPTIMQGFWDDQIEQWSVDLCFFPLIGINLKSEKHRKVLYAARVLAVKEKEKKTLIKTTMAIISKASKAIGSQLNDKNYNAKVVKSDDRYAGAKTTGTQYDDRRYQHDDRGYQPDDGRYQSNDRRYQSHDNAYQLENRRHQSDDSRNQSDDRRIHSDDRKIHSDDSRTQYYDSRNQSDDRRIHSDDRIIHSDDSRTQYYDRKIQPDDRRTQSDDSHSGARNKDVLQVKNSNRKIDKVTYDKINQDPLHVVHPDNPSNYTKNSGMPERSNSFPTPNSPINSTNSRKSSLDSTQIGHGQHEGCHDSDSPKKEHGDFFANSEPKRNTRETKRSENYINEDGNGNYF